MKRIIAAAICLCALVAAGCAQETPVVDLPVDYAAIEAELRAELDDYARAWNEKDMDAISRMWAHDDDIVIFGAQKRARVIGWEGSNGVRARYMNSFNSMQSIDFSYDDLMVKVSTDGTAGVLTYYVTNTYTDMDGNVHTIQPRITVVRERRDGEWKTIHAYSSYSVEALGSR